MGTLLDFALREPVNVLWFRCSVGELVSILPTWVGLSCFRLAWRLWRLANVSNQ